MVAFGGGCAAPDTPAAGVSVDRETISQVSTIDAILDGVYDGVLSCGDLRRYGDFGLGTFAGLDGEGIFLDGDFYQVKADGAEQDERDDRAVAGTGVPAVPASAVAAPTTVAARPGRPRCG